MTRAPLDRPQSKVHIFFSFWNVFSWAQLLAGESICPQRLSGNGTREGRARILVIQGITAAKGD
jgi:hypothetical protein